jgi:hypothetical protein
MEKNQEVVAHTNHPHDKGRKSKVGVLWSMHTWPKSKTLFPK